MFRLLSEAKTGVILLKIEIFYNKTGLRFPLSCKVSETFFYTNSYTGKKSRNYFKDSVLENCIGRGSE